MGKSRLIFVVFAFGTIIVSISLLYLNLYSMNTEGTPTEKAISEKLNKRCEYLLEGDIEKAAEETYHPPRAFEQNMKMPLKELEDCSYVNIHKVRETNDTYVVGGLLFYSKGGEGIGESRILYFRRINGSWKEVPKSYGKKGISWDFSSNKFQTVIGGGNQGPGEIKKEKHLFNKGWIEKKFNVSASAVMKRESLELALYSEKVNCTSTPFKLIFNGEERELKCSKFPDWSGWMKITIEKPLKPGENTVRLVDPTSEDGNSVQVWYNKGLNRNNTRGSTENKMEGELIARLVIYHPEYGEKKWLEEKKG